ncbi:MAG: aminotransferase class I/II-fold pyridoxal phosphate-dependent enzyme [Bacteroidota bacterium]|nr:aminotransferase class I/II-fold pyridoxal phosphate-dependent enzyme [Bacteroidota bacterium]
MSTADYQFDTLKIRAGYNPAEHGNSIQVPIYQTAAFDLISTERAHRILRMEELAYVYTRVGNPTNAALEARVAALDGASGAVSVASGMAAISYALLNVGEGGRVIVAAQIYGGTYDAYKKIYPRLGVQVDILEDVNDLEAIKALIKDDTRAIFIESISNPINVVADIEAIANLAHKNGLPLIVDNTFATPYLLNPIKHGADVVVYSATKALSGHGSVIAGLVLESGKFNWAGGRHPQFTEKHYTLGDRSIIEALPDFPFVGRIRTNLLGLLGATLSPFDAYLVLQGIETLSERVKKQTESAQKIAEFLTTHPKVSWVSLPTLPGSKYNALAKKYLTKGAGGTFSFGFKGTEEEVNQFIEKLELFAYHANVGDARSLVINSAQTTHHELTEEEQSKAGIKPETVRLSIGLEDVNDLIADLKQAFEN